LESIVVLSNEVFPVNDVMDHLGTAALCVPPGIVWVRALEARRPLFPGVSVGNCWVSNGKIGWHLIHEEDEFSVLRSLGRRQSHALSNGCRIGKALEWIVDRGLERRPDQVSSE
jgi:hypothetical protein